MDLSPDFVEYVKVGFHLLGEKVELSVAFARWSNEFVLLQCPDMVLSDTIVNVDGLSELVDIVRLFTEEIDDLATICSAA